MRDMVPIHRGLTDWPERLDLASVKVFERAKRQSLMGSPVVGREKLGAPLSGVLGVA